MTYNPFTILYEAGLPRGSRSKPLFDKISTPAC